MAVKTFCDDIIKAYTHCNSVVAIYTYCNLVWPTGPIPPGRWYVSWLPSDISGPFSMFGQTYRLEDYSGLYSWSGPASTSGIISGYFQELYVPVTGKKTYMETNVLSIGGGAFEYNYSLSVISCSRCRYIGDDAFRSCTSLQYVSLPKCLSISYRAFMNCNRISYASLPVIKYISYGAFQGCSNLHYLYAPECEYVTQHAFQDDDLYYVDLPKCSYIGNSAFMLNEDLSWVSLPVCEFLEGDAFTFCENLTSVYLPACSIVHSAFVGCNNLESIELPACTSTMQTFDGCTVLNYVSLPVCEHIGYYTFRDCDLSSIELPACKEVDYGAFAGCGNISYIDLGECSSINEPGDPYSGVFQDCVNLKTVILRGSSSVCKLGLEDESTFVLNAFENTPIARCSGYIYVHPIMLGDYKTTQWWSAVSCAFRSYSAEHGSYYVSWTPTITSGSFLVDGHTCLFEDFSSHFDWLTGTLPESMFYENSIIEQIDTNCYEIDEYAFAYCSSLMSVNLPGCSYIGSDAFKECTSLSQISLPMCESIGNYAFDDCSRLQSIDLPLCSFLSDNAFNGCTSLSQISLPVCETIGLATFRSCSYLRSIELPVCSDIGGYAFQSCSRLSIVVLGYSSVASIGYAAFAGCSLLTYILVPSSLVSVYKSNIWWSNYSSKLFPITDPHYMSWTPVNYNGTFTLNGITYSTRNYNGYFIWYDGSTITASAFKSQSITTFETDADVIGVAAFADCTSLSQVSLSKCTSVSGGAFENCTSLSQISFPMCEYIGATTFRRCSSLRSVNLPECSYIGYGAFADCYNLTELNIPKCKVISNWAFGNCTSLSQISLSMCESIGDIAFDDCLVSYVDLPVCSYIGGFAFNISNLTVVLGSSSVCKIESTTFSGVSNISIYVPSSLVNAYKTYSNWSQYSSRIFPIPS